MGKLPEVEGRRPIHAHDGPHQDEAARAPRPPAAGVARTLAGAPVALTPAGVRALQRAIGNAAVIRLLTGQQHIHDAGCEGEQPVQLGLAVHDVLSRPGQPMEAAKRAEMEARMGHDFSDVRIQTDAAAKASASEIGARAYTSGNHIVIGEGGGDRHTLAHELAHVIQQRQGPVAGTDNRAGLSVSDPSDYFERAAEVTATRVMDGEPPLQHEARRRVAADGERGGHPVAGAETAGGHIVQRALDEQMMGVIKAAEETLGIEERVKIVQLPADVEATTPFKDYPENHVHGLSSEEELNRSLWEVCGMERSGREAGSAQTASEGVAQAGGGGYLPKYGLILLGQPTDGASDYTLEQIIWHEIGHQRQQELGFSVDMSGAKRALVEYHNILINENKLRTQAVPPQPMRVKYADEGFITTRVSEAAEREGIDLKNRYGPEARWEALKTYINGKRTKESLSCSMRSRRS